MAAINRFPSVYHAEHRHGDRKGCLEGTRIAVLDKIELWTKDFDRPQIYWLNGMAGTGNTTIAQTVADRLAAAGQLGASFFCSQDSKDQSDLGFIFPTLAVQLVRKYTKLQSELVPLAIWDPGVAGESLYNQMNELIVRPLKESAISTVIVADALDECEDSENISALLSAFEQLVSQVPKVGFFITARPESWIREGFRLPLLAEVTEVFALHDVEASVVDHDIQLFLKQSLLQRAYHRDALDDGWPTEEQLDPLCGRAAGLFIYAEATVKFVHYKFKIPERRLDLILRSPDNTGFEGRTEIGPNKTLDSLDMLILRRFSASTRVSIRRFVLSLVLWSSP